MSLHNTCEKVLIITKDDKIVSKNTSLDVTEMINFCSAEEADAKLVRHMIHCVKFGFHNVVVRTVDTDVLILVISFTYFTDQYGHSNVFVHFVVTKQSILT